MENLETVRKYELMVIVDAKLTEDAKEVIFKEVAETVVKFEGKVINNQIWMEKHKFTFEIKKHTEGTYSLFNIEGDTSLNDNLTTSLNLNEKILRFLIIKVD